MYGTIPLRSQQFLIFTTIRRQIWQIFDPSPLENADVLNRWSLFQSVRDFSYVLKIQMWLQKGYALIVIWLEARKISQTQESKLVYLV